MNVLNLSSNFSLSLVYSEQWRRSRHEISISSLQLQIGLRVSWKLCLNLCFLRCLETSLNLVHNCILFGLFQRKTIFLEEGIYFEILTMKLLKFWELRMFRSSLFHSIKIIGKDCNSRCSHLNLRSRACFEQGVPWHSCNHNSETPTWHDKNIQTVFKGCLPQILLGPFLNILTRM